MPPYSRARARRIVAIAALLGVLTAAACTKVGAGDATGGRHPWTHPGELRIAVQGDPTTLNPVLAATTTEALLNRLSFDPLLSVEPDGKTLVPILATRVPTIANGLISRDGLTITYPLRAGVRWQDGAPFTSRDVKFSWEALVNDQNNVNERVGYDDIASVDTPSALTVVFHLKHKFAPFIDSVFAEGDGPGLIVPEHLLARYHDINRIPFNDQPIGTGAFRVVRWVRGDHIEFIANPDYFRGKPKLGSILVRLIPDENTTLNALRTHDIDWMFEPSPDLYNVIKTLPDTTVHFEDGPQTLRLFINHQRPILRDARVRQAIAYAIDKKALVDRLTGGSAVVAGADQPPFSWAYDKDAGAATFDPAKARALLADDGYRPGPDGILRKNGMVLSLDLSTNSSNATRRLVQTQLQAMLHDVGIDTQVKNYPSNLFFATKGQGGILASARYDLAIGGWVAGLDPDDHTLFACDQYPPNGANYDRYCSAAMDAAQARALGSYDESIRRPAYIAIQELIARDIPEIIIWYARFPQATNPDFKGFAPNPVNEAWNAYQWEI